MVLSKEEISLRNIVYKRKHRDKLREDSKKWYNNNKEHVLNLQKKRRLNLKIEALNLIGDCKCSICGDTNINHLTIDHIKNDGNYYRKNSKYSKTGTIHLSIVKERLTEEEFKSLRVLCWNHNASYNRGYLDLPEGKQTVKQKYYTKLWKETFNFFGPCKTCGETDLKFLTISHIHNNGAKRRRNGEGVGKALIQRFRKQNWPESLKLDYCLECWNCNSSRR